MSGIFIQSPNQKMSAALHHAHRPVTKYFVLLLFERNICLGKLPEVRGEKEGKRRVKLGCWIGGEDIQREKGRWNS